jgi:hypothetical protein
MKGLCIGEPTMLDQQDLDEELQHVRDMQEDESLRFRQGRQTACVPSLSNRVSDDDIKVLRSKHPFLADFSDAFLRNTPVGDLMKIQSTALKAGELEKAKDVDDKLAFNKSALATTLTTVGLN